MKKLLFNLISGKYFPFQFQLLGLIFLIFGVLLIMYSLYISPLFLIISVFILTGYRGIEFDKERKVYRTYNSFLFMKFGQWTTYHDIENLFINSGISSQKVYTKVTEGITIKNMEYNAYLKFDDESKIHLKSSKNKKRLFKRLDKLSHYLGVDIIDYTIKP